MKITICESKTTSSKILQVSRSYRNFDKEPYFVLDWIPKIDFSREKRCRSDKISLTHPISELKASWRELDKEELAIGRWERDWVREEFRKYQRAINLPGIWRLFAFFLGHVFRTLCIAPHYIFIKYADMTNNVSLCCMRSNILLSFSLFLFSPPNCK